MSTDAKAKRNGFTLDQFRIYASCLSGEDIWYLLGDQICQDMSINRLFHSFVAFSLMEVDESFSSWIQQASSVLNTLLENFKTVIVNAYSMKNASQRSYTLPRRISYALSMNVKLSWVPKEGSAILSNLKNSYALKKLPSKLSPFLKDELTKGKEEAVASVEMDSEEEEEREAPPPLEDPLFIPGSMKTCSKCGKTFASASYLLNRHKDKCKGRDDKTKELDVPLRCGRCYRRYTTYPYLKHHLSICGTPEANKKNALYIKGKPACRKCGKVFSSFMEKQEAKHTCDPLCHSTVSPKKDPPPLAIVLAPGSSLQRRPIVKDPPLALSTPPLKSKTSLDDPLEDSPLPLKSKTSLDDPLEDRTSLDDPLEDSPLPLKSETSLNYPLEDSLPPLKRETSLDDPLEDSPPPWLLDPH